MTSKRIFLLKQLLWFLCQLYKIIKITLIFFVSLLYDCSDLLWFVSETLKHSLIFVETLTENQFRSIPYLDSSCELSNVLFALGGHSTTTWTQFWPPAPSSNCGHLTYSLSFVHVIKFWLSIDLYLSLINVVIEWTPKVRNSFLIM